MARLLAPGSALVTYAGDALRLPASLLIERGIRVEVRARRLSWCGWRADRRRVLAQGFSLQRWMSSSGKEAAQRLITDGEPARAVQRGCVAHCPSGSGASGGRGPGEAHAGALRAIEVQRCAGTPPGAIPRAQGRARSREVIYICGHGGGGLRRALNKSTAASASFVKPRRRNSSGAMRPCAMRHSRYWRLASRHRVATWSLCWRARQAAHTRTHAHTQTFRQSM